MADPLEELAALEAGTALETEEAPEGEVAETPADPEIPRSVADRYGDPRSDPEAVEKLIAGYDELQRHSGRQGQEYGQMRQQFEQQAQQIAELQQQQEQAQSYQPDATIEQWQELYADDPFNATALLIAESNRLIQQQLDERLDQSLSPIQKDRQVEQVQRISVRLHNEFGEDTIQRNLPRIQAEMAKDPSIREGDPDIVYGRLRRIVTESEWERGNAATRGNGKPAATRVEGGGSGGRPVGQVREEELSPAEQIKRDMLQNKPQFDLFGNAKRQTA